MNGTEIGFAGDLVHKYCLSYTQMRELIRFSDALNGMYVATAVGILIGFMIGYGYMKMRYGENGIPDE